jgi:aryl-alcohol dehydrogenase-like predicted oxidoreductase
MTFGQQVDEATGHTIMDRAWRVGVNFFDTAEIYAVPPTAESFGKTETILATGWPSARCCASRSYCATKVAALARHAFGCAPLRA